MLMGVVSGGAGGQGVEAEGRSAMPLLDLVKMASGHLIQSAIDDPVGPPSKGMA